MIEDYFDTVGIKNVSATASTAGSSDGDDNQITQVAKKVLRREQTQKVMPVDAKQVIERQRHEIQRLRARYLNDTSDSMKKTVYQQSTCHLMKHQLKNRMHSQATIIDELKAQLDRDEMFALPMRFLDQSEVQITHIGRNTENLVQSIKNVVIETMGQANNWAEARRLIEDSIENIVDDQVHVTTFFTDSNANFGFATAWTKCVHLKIKDNLKMKITFM